MLRDRFRDSKKERVEAAALTERLRAKVIVVLMAVIVMVRVRVEAATRLDNIDF